MDRLTEADERGVAWRRWGPYLSERQWGTVREDYSPGGNAWDYFTHDQARSRAYRWGEDGLGGISDDKQVLCFALALWNERDPILKERLFGLTNSEANHGEDVKEYYFYLDSTPTHSYMKYLYKYPQAAYPYGDLIRQNGARSREEFEYELLDTGVFDEDRYFDVQVEYAKESAEDVLIRIRVTNRGPEAAPLHVLPTLWFRNTWSWFTDASAPQLERVAGPKGVSVIAVRHPDLGERYLYCQALDGSNASAPPLLFTENETNTARLFGAPNRTPYVKDGINNFVVNGQADAVNSAQVGTKAAPHYRLEVGAGETVELRLRLTETPPTASATSNGAGKKGLLGTQFDATFKARQKEADEFYESITPPSLDADRANVMRQALAGMLWSKQFYYYDVDRWLSERGSDPLRPQPKAVPRNGQWYHMLNTDIISMPDKWEYPWFAAWDLAFHTIALQLVDPAFAKQQLTLMLNEHYLHPNGQIPAYEWNFGDVNPPVHAWATIFLYNNEKQRTGKGDLDFLKRAFNKLVLNFTWWVNRKDPTGKNVFEGGFLGLDNIGVFDRSAALPTGGHLEQADGTAWMCLFSQNMLQIALELSLYDPEYDDMALKFFEHFLWISAAMDRVGENQDEMWDEADGFFYDLLRLPDGSARRLQVRSMVGLLPLCASTVLTKEILDKIPELRARARFFGEQHPELMENINPPGNPGANDSRLLAILNEDKLRRVLARMLDENEFLSPYGIRALSRYHQEHPFTVNVDGQDFRVDYLPAESNTGMFGGNSNWRGPIWMPVNGLLVRGLLNLYTYYGDEFKVECPTGSGKMMTLFEVAHEISDRLARIFLRDEHGRRPVYGGSAKFQDDPHWRDYILFYEYFHGDNGAGLGASHQTGWTGIVAKLIQLFGSVSGQELLSQGTQAGVAYRRRQKA
jgi:hypothetical protein